ncbi:PPAP2A.2 family protein [Megaselia abdita]
MSSESTVSETTPLSRPDSSYLNDSTTSSTNEHYKHTNNNNNNNNEVRTSAVRPSTQNNNYIVTNIEDTNNKMDPKHTSATNGRIIRRIIYDIIVLAAVGFPILCMFLWGQPYKRGFFCDDESIKHPFHESTVKSWMLWIIGFILPVIMVVSTEIFLANRNRSIPSVSVTCVERKVPSWAIEVYKVIGVYMFGAAVQQLITDIAKYTVGRLRPHFYSVSFFRLLSTTYRIEFQNAKFAFMNGNDSSVESVSICKFNLCIQYPCTPTYPVGNVISTGGMV